MALTNKSAIPLDRNDLRLIESELRFYDRRLALRLGFQQVAMFRRLIDRYSDDMESRGLGKVCHRDTVVQGGATREYFLTIPQALFVVARSDAKNALDVLAEITLVIGALRTGAPIPDTPWTDALFAPNVPTVEPGDDNIVHVKHEEWEQPALFDDAVVETQRETADLAQQREAPRLTPHPSQWSPSYDKWRERTIETTLPRPVGRRHLDCISDMAHTPQGYGDSTEDKPTMFLRDQLPIGHHADSWRVWVSEQWFRLPLDLRQRWWRDTDYGNRAPSAEMIKAIIAIALP